MPLRVVYGYPSAELFEEADAGRVRLGGCVVTDFDPAHACPECGEPFFDSEEQEAGYRLMWPREQTPN